MKITFLYPDLISSSTYKGYFYSGIGYLSAVLKQARYNVSLIHITQPLKREELIYALKARQPDLVAFSSTTNMFDYVKKWSKWIKEHIKIPIICGGIHATLYPEEVISHEHIDFVCVGEGEEALVELCEAYEKGKDFTKIRNIWVKSQSGVHRNLLRPLIGNLDCLPFPDRSIYDYPSLYHEREGRAVIMASRGCPFNCSYCCNHALKHTYKNLGAYLRFRSADNVITEIKQVIARHPFIKAFAFDDDILPIKKEWLLEFAAKYSKEVAMPFSCNIFPTLVDKDTVRTLKTAGCVEVHIGVESGNDYIRNKILNRNISNEAILKALHLCKSEGLRIYTYNMVGLPNEGIREMLDTVKLNAKNSDINQVSIFFPYKGTKLYEICKDQNLLTNKIIDDYFKDSSLNFPKIKLNQILFIKNYFRVLVRIYSMLDKTSHIFKDKGHMILDWFLSSHIAAYTIFPLAEKASGVIYKNKRFYEIARMLKKRFLDR